LHANLVIGAASPIGNSELLLRSTAARRPRGLGNHSGLVGRYMMTHAALVVYGMFREHTAPYRGISGAQLIGQDDYRHGEQAGYQWLIAPAMKPNDVLGVGDSRPGVAGHALTEFMRRGMHHLASMLAMAEDIPLTANRLTLAAGRPVVTHRQSGKTLRAVARLREQGLAVMRAAGARDAWSGPVGSAHIMGGTVMGESPARSVTDPFGRVHDIENLYLVGASVFPTGGAVNPTFTLHATTLRTVTHIIDSRHTGEAAAGQ
jgi:choline dehydrogenase-like flavoprotein